MGHVDGIRIIKAGCQIGDSPSGCTIGANGNSTGRSFPGCRGVCGGFIGGSRNRIIAFSICFSSCCRYRIAADGYAAINGNICIMANDCGVRSSQFLILIFFLICRTDDDIVLSICQGVVIADDDIRLVLVDAVTSYTVVGTNDVVIFAVSQFVLEAIDEVVLRRRAFCIGAVCARDGVADTDNLAHIGAFDVIAAAHDHDLSTTLRNSSL